MYDQVMAFCLHHSDMNFSKNWSLIVVLIVGILVGWGISKFINPLAETSPRIHIGQNEGRIVTFDVAAWPTPNFLFQQEGRLPIVFYPAVGDMMPPVTLLDGRTLTYLEFVEDFNTTVGENYSHTLFSIDYQENDVDELGYVIAINQIQ